MECYISPAGANPYPVIGIISPGRSPLLRAIYIVGILKSGFIVCSAAIGDRPWREFEVGFMTIKKTDHFIDHQGKHPGITRSGHTSNMGTEEYVGKLTDFAVGWNRLRIEDVKPGDNIPAFETGYKRIGIDNSPP